MATRALALLLACAAGTPSPAKWQRPGSARPVRFYPADHFDHVAKLDDAKTFNEYITKNVDAGIHPAPHPPPSPACQPGPHCFNSAKHQT